MEVTREVRGKKKLVYIIVAKKALKYHQGRSKIVYIGTTRNGVNRLAQSVAARAPKVLNIRGVREFLVRIMVCAPRPNVKTWEKLERTLLIVFRQRHEELPKCNVAGKKMKLRDEFSYFKRERLEKLLDEISR